MTLCKAYRGRSRYGDRIHILGAYNPLPSTQMRRAGAFFGPCSQADIAFVCRSQRLYAAWYCSQFQYRCAGGLDCGPNSLRSRKPDSFHGPYRACSSRSQRETRIEARAGQKSQVLTNSIQVPLQVYTTSISERFFSQSQPLSPVLVQLN